MVKYNKYLKEVSVLNINKIYDRMSSVDKEKYEKFVEAYGIIDVLDMPEGIEKELDLRYPLWDHASLFLSKSGRILCLQPYLGDLTCKSITNKLNNVRVLGRRHSFYYPDCTNMVLIFLDVTFDKGYATSDYFSDEEYVKIRERLTCEFGGMKYFDRDTCQFKGIPLNEDVVDILKSDVLKCFGKNLVFAVIDGENVIGVEGML